jgi:hypothetical protein
MAGLFDFLGQQQGGGGLLGGAFNPLASNQNAILGYLAGALQGGNLGESIGRGLTGWQGGAQADTAQANQRQAQKSALGYIAGAEDIDPRLKMAIMQNPALAAQYLTSMAKPAEFKTAGPYYGSAGPGGKFNIQGTTPEFKTVEPSQSAGFYTPPDPSARPGTGPAYQAAERQQVFLPPSASLAEAIRIARNDPIVGPTIANLPDSSVGVIDAAQIGKVAKTDTTEGALSAVFPAKPPAGGEREIATAVRSIARNDPQAAADLVRQHAERTFNSAARDLVGGENQMGGARFRSFLIGDAQAERNLRAAVRELPGGQTTWQGFERFLDVLQATGRRRHIGSQTELNRLLTKQIEGGTLAGTPISLASSPSSLASYIRGAYQEYRHGRNTEGLARLFADPGAAPLFREILQYGPGAARSQLAAARLIAMTNQPAQPAP